MSDTPIRPQPKEVTGTFDWLWAMSAWKLYGLLMVLSAAVLYFFVHRGVDPIFWTGDIGRAVGAAAGTLLPGAAIVGVARLFGKLKEPQAARPLILGIWAFLMYVSLQSY